MSRTLELNVFRNRLHALRGRLDERAAALRDEACRGAGGEDAGELSHAPIHLADRAAQESEVVVNLGLAENEASLRQEIDEALLRLETGSFGICEECHNTIDAERLKALPYARLCIGCAKS